MNKEEITLRAKQLLDENNLSQFGWTFEFNNRKRACGLCWFKAKKIQYSSYFIDREDSQIENTLTHEIAHAICFMNGTDDGHGIVWQKTHISLGGNGERVAEASGIVIKAKYVYKCPSCGGSSNYHRKPKRVGACRNCCIKYSNGKYDEKFKLQLEE